MSCRLPLTIAILPWIWTPVFSFGSEPVKNEATPKEVDLQLSMPRTRIAPGDDLVIAGRLKNVSGKNLPFFDTAMPALRFVEKKGGQAWVTKASLFPPPPGAPPSLSTWKADEVRTFTIRLTPQTQFAHAGAKPDTARVGLPPGKYLLHCTLTYLDHYPEWKKNPFVGTLKPAPMELEVVGE